MKFKLGLCQMKGSADKTVSKAAAKSMVGEAAANGAQVIALPEMWNCPYSNDFFREYAEDKNGPAVEFLSELAAKNNVYLIGGSIPEMENGKVFNTSFSFDRQGQLIGTHRKVHLFDIDVKGGIRFMESETLSPGNHTTIIETEFGKLGVAICYDVRFPELTRRMALEGAQLVILPAAFNLTTGPAHWHLTMRARALDNQIYFAAVSPARDMEGPYQAYGHSCIATPWGELVAEADIDETIVYGDIDLDYVSEIRQQLPLLKHRKPEVY